MEPISSYLPYKLPGQQPFLCVCCYCFSLPFPRRQQHSVQSPDPVQYHHHHQLHLSCTYPSVCLSTWPESCPAPPPPSVSVRHYIHKGEPPVHYYYVNPIMPKTTIGRECLAAATAILVLFAILNLLLQTNNQFKN